ncbi:hypothetical protein PWF70_23950 (plasmid) [Gordonia sp. Swx-4]|uniref:hypothetical protein n=1 Tax=Gordonia sp. Swx-4 TaxID=3029399 RepID=UPI002573A394|nr:hypothetical protein [Gordonia sp. Swx-4]WJG15962.1 hypothetical protein PWF70_23950 [Gordonia sp. Swx-4]
MTRWQPRRRLDPLGQRPEKFRGGGGEASTWATASWAVIPVAAGRSWRRTHAARRQSVEHQRRGRPRRGAPSPGSTTAVIARPGSLEGYQTILTWALAWWIKLPNPQLDNSSSLMQEVHDHTLQIQIVGLTFSLMFFGLRMMIDRKRSMADDAEEGFKLIFRSAMATAAIPLALTVGGQIADGISNWLVSESVTAGGGNGDVIKNFLKLNLLTNSALGTTAIGIFALVGFLGAFLQLALLVVREAMLLLVVAALPVAAAFSGTGPGSQSYQRLVAWSVAFLLFKPVGALTYFVAFRAGASKDNAQQVVLGMVLMMLCAFVLPALMRLIAPAVASMGGGGSGAAAAGAAIGAGVAAGKVAAMAASGGATAGASGGASAGGMSSIAGRGGGGPSGGISTASAPSPPPSGGGGPARNPPSPAARADRPAPAAVVAAVVQLPGWATRWDRPADSPGQPCKPSPTASNPKSNPPAPTRH